MLKLQVLSWDTDGVVRSWWRVTMRHDVVCSGSAKPVCALLKRYVLGPCTCAFDVNHHPAPPPPTEVVFSMVVGLLKKFLSAAGGKMTPTPHSHIGPTIISWEGGGVITTKTPVHLKKTRPIVQYLKRKFSCVVSINSESSVGYVRNDTNQHKKQHRAHWETTETYNGVMCVRSREKIEKLWGRVLR